MFSKKLFKHKYNKGVFVNAMLTYNEQYSFEHLLIFVNVF